jgi:hypothetical protein
MHTFSERIASGDGGFLHSREWWSYFFSQLIIWTVGVSFFVIIGLVVFEVLTGERVFYRPGWAKRRELRRHPPKLHVVTVNDWQHDTGPIPPVEDYSSDDWTESAPDAAYWSARTQASP